TDNANGYQCFSNPPFTRCTIQLANVATTGNYTLLVQPYFNTSGTTINGTATLRNEVATTLVDGTPQTANLAGAQNAAFRFSGTAGSNPALELTFSPNAGWPSTVV